MSPENEEVDTPENTIDTEGIAIITRVQPVAHDFRWVFSPIKAATDLERVADQAVSIGEDSLYPGSARDIRH